MQENILVNVIKLMTFDHILNVKKFATTTLDISFKLQHEDFLKLKQIK